MIQRKLKVCKSCGADAYIWSMGCCKSCSNKQVKPIKKVRKPTGEKDLFFEIWNERPHVCVNCKCNLGNEAKAHFFSHIISKKKEPKLRLEKSNIWLLCFDCHYLYDFSTKDKFNERKNLYIGNL
jgi:hypothetical protein